MIDEILQKSSNLDEFGVNLEEKEVDEEDEYNKKKKLKFLHHKK